MFFEYSCSITESLPSLLLQSTTVHKLSLFTDAYNNIMVYKLFLK